MPLKALASARLRTLLGARISRPNVATIRGLGLRLRHFAFRTLNAGAWNPLGHGPSHVFKRAGLVHRDVHSNLIASQPKAFKTRLRGFRFKAFDFKGKPRTLMPKLSANSAVSQTAQAVQVVFPNSADTGSLNSKP